MLKKLFAKSLVYFIILTAGKLLSAAFLIVLARIFLPAQLGEITYFVTLAALVAAIFDFGFRQFYQKKMATKPHQWLFTQLLFLRILLFVLSSTIVIGLHYLTPLTMPFLPLLILYNLAEALFCISDSYYLSQGKTIVIGLRILIRNLLLFIPFICLLLFPEQISFSVLFYMIHIVVVSFIVIIFYFPYRILYFQSLDFSWQKIKDLLKKTWTYAAMDTSNILYSRADSLVMQNTLGSAALGIYGSAYRFLDAFNLMPQALFHNLFSLAAKEKSINKHQLKIMLATMGALGFVVGLGLIFLSRPLIPWLLGAAYAPAVPILQIFGIVVFLFFLNSPLHVVIQSSRFLKQYLPWMGSVVVFNLILNLVLLPITNAITTAAWVLVVTQIATIVVNSTFIKRLKLQ